MKYVMLNGYLPIVFTESIQHDSFKSCGVTSAGFCEITWDGKGVKAYGESVSLKMKPNSKDSEILTKFMIK